MPAQVSMPSQKREYPLREIAEAIGKGLNVPVVSLSPEQAQVGTFRLAWTVRGIGYARLPVRRPAKNWDGTRQAPPCLPILGICGTPETEPSASLRMTTSRSFRRLDGILCAEAAHAAQERGRAADGECDNVAIVLSRVNDHAGFNRGERRTLLLRHAEFRIDDGIGVQRAIDGRE